MEIVGTRIGAKGVFVGLVLVWSLGFLLGPMFIGGSVGTSPDPRCATLREVGLYTGAEYGALTASCVASSRAARPPDLIGDDPPISWQMVWIVGVGLAAVFVTRYPDALRPG